MSHTEMKLTTNTPDPLETLIKSMLSDDTPVTGAHLDIFIKMMSLHGQTKKTMLGLSDPSYTRIMSNPSEIIGNPPTSLLIRFLFKNPDKFFLPRVVFADLLAITGLSEEHLSLIIGRHYLSATRYMNTDKSQEMRTATQRLSYHIYSDIINKKHSTEYFVNLAKLEARERGMGDLLMCQRWKKNAPKNSNPMTIKDLDWFRLTRNLTLRMLLTYVGINRVDLTALRNYLDLSNPSHPKFNFEEANEIGNTAIADASSALLLRYYRENPEKLVYPEEPTIHDLLSISKVNEKEIGILLGRDSFSAHRWKGRTSINEHGLGQSMHWSVQVLASYFLAEVKEGRLNEWRKMVLNEGKHYGIMNVIDAGSWDRNKKAP
jgi:hypothetical protein